ncbi:hypothetical protein L3X38_011004 [Prunus dulcis]|uniref:Uncharacterized protein n=1 Tax=Prunus dulcis TaxID=3755 RepID=A0AAD4WGK8_PRUDU|nr:hypothetical protein L3X38_011004 [Prunus dulcis]
MVVLRSFPAVIVEPAALISLVFTESMPPSFSLLRRPNPTPEGGDDYVEFGAPGSTDICCHCACICCHCASTDRPLGSWSRKVPRRLLHQLHQWHSLLAPGGVIGPPAPLTPHPLMCRAKKEHPMAVSAVEDGEGHPGDQQLYQHRIRRATSGYTDGEVA